MNEEKNTPANGKPFKKSASGKKSSTGKHQQEQTAPEQPTKTATLGNAVSIIQKIDDIRSEVEGNPVKSFEKKDKEKLIQSYEKLISRLVWEINHSR